MDKRENFLAIALIDALEDENISCILKLIKEHNINPNYVAEERHLAPIHFSCGMENLEMAENVTKLLLECGGDPNLQTPDEDLTPLHIAAMSGRQNIVRMLLNKGGNIHLTDKDNRTPLQYAVFDCHFEVIETMKKFVFENKFKTKNTENEIEYNYDSPNKDLSKDNFLSIKLRDENVYTPNRINYNFDISSPYYVNITHRKKNNTKNLDNENITLDKNVKNNQIDSNVIIKDSQTLTSNFQSYFSSTMYQDTIKQNLFELTEENLWELTKNETNEPSRVSLIQSWREKVQQSRNRQSIIYQYNNIENLLDGIISDENVDFTNTSVNLVCEKNVKKKTNKSKFDQTAFGKLLNTLRANKSLISETSFTTALAPEEHKKYLSEKNLVSANAEPFLYQMSEKYQYIDRDEGLIFFEEKLAMSAPSKTEIDLNKSYSTISTQITVPSDYDTEALREELTSYGEPPGPITKTTKRMYTKRLIKFKRDPEKMLAIQKSLSNNENVPCYSIELLKTVKCLEWFNRISEYYEFEEEMSVQFKNNHKIPEKKWREGNSKQSFIYLLIDPRISKNLPAKSKFAEEHEIWKQFLSSIFYVGKGKSNRPFSHLYEAMKIHMRSKNENSVSAGIENLNIRRLITTGSNSKTSNLLFKRYKKSLEENEKLKRILDIWKEEYGVICLHVFHNILPAEAYTREAAIIDAIGLDHLTNMKRGDYYGPAGAWTMRKRKCLGVSLLSKALKIFISEGESQLFPSDLI